MDERDARRLPTREPAPHVIDLAGLERARSAGDGSRPEPVRGRGPRTGDAGPGGPSHRAGRRTRVVAVAGVVALAVTSVLAVVSWQRGIDWRDVALAQQARADDLAAQLRAADADVRAAADAVDAARVARDAAVAEQQAASGRLDSSESDVVELERRIAALAGEKARLEDELAIAGAAVRAGSGSAASGGTTGTAACLRSLDAWLAAAPDGDGPAAWQDWVDRSPVSSPSCDALR